MVQQQWVKDPTIFTPDTTPRKANRPWTSGEDAILFDCVRRGEKLRVIAEKLERSKGAISSRIKHKNLR